MHFVFGAQLSAQRKFKGLHKISKHKAYISVIVKLLQQRLQSCKSLLKVQDEVHLFLHLQQTRTGRFLRENIGFIWTGKKAQHVLLGMNKKNNKESGTEPDYYENHRGMSPLTPLLRITPRRNEGVMSVFVQWERGRTHPGRGDCLHVSVHMQLLI